MKKQFCFNSESCPMRVVQTCEMLTNTTMTMRKTQQMMLMLTLITLTIAHLKIALLGGNPEVGDSEYMNHQNCPPQLI